MRRSRRLDLVILATVFTSLGVAPAWAGQFEVREVKYAYQDSTLMANTRVMVGATAEYVGTMDDMGNQWNMWTLIRVFGSWSSNGGQVGGEVMESGQVVTLVATNQGSYADINHCTPAGDPVQYTGKGVVSIYHGNYFFGMGGGPEIHEKQGSTGQTVCSMPPEENGPGDGPEGSEESPPGDGTGCSDLVLVDLETVG